jgi:2,4-diaminopentanoate dehydrogenase
MTSRANDVLRVVQWTTGNVAVETVKALLARPDLVLVGAYAYSPEKVGVDVGTLCNLGRARGVHATNNVDALLALEPDCVLYNPLHLDVIDADRAAIEAAARDGDATIFGSGMNPGFAQMVAAISSGISTNVRKASMTESVDVSQFIGDANFQSVGWGRP